MSYSLRYKLAFCFTLLGLSAVFGPTTGQAQAPTVVAVRPARHTSNAARAANVKVAFSQPISATSAAAPAGLRVFGNLLRGRRPAVLRGGGTDTLTLDPGQDFAPGELVSVSISSALQSAAGVPVQGQVYQFLAATGGSGRGVFSAASTLGSLSATAATALADTDNDGDLDVVNLVVPASGLRSLSIGLNNGAGAFPTQTAVSISTSTLSIVLGDLDADGDLDLVSVNRQYVSYRLNSGTGFFGTETVLSNGNITNQNSDSRALALGDLDADGDLDIVTTDISSSSVVVMLNSGAGTFAPGVVVPVAPQPVGLALGDFDNDGDLDLATTHQPLYGQTGSVGLATNDGVANFTVGASIGVGHAPDYLTAADFDNDGRLDLAVANTSDFTATILRNTGAMAFAAGSPVLLGNYPVALRAADVDADGDLDLLAPTNRSGLAAVVQALNVGNGTFTTAASLPGLSGSTTLAAGDLDGDGDLDLAVGQTVGSVIALNQPALAPAISSLTPARGTPGTQVVVRGSNLLTTSSCAFNGTPALSFTVSSATQLTVEVPAGATTGPVTLATAAGTATSAGDFRVTGPVQLTSSRPAAQALAAPVGGGVSLTFDRPIETASAGNVAVYGNLRQGRRAGTTTVTGNTVRFQPAVPFAPGEDVRVTIPTSLASDTTGNTTRRMVQFTAATSGTGRSAVFLPVAPVPLTQSTGRMVVGDLDGDGDVDLIAASMTNMAVRFNNGAAGYSGTQTLALPASPQELRALRLGDVDGDGDLDLVVAAASYTYSGTVGQVGSVTVFRNNGLGVFTAPGTPAVTMLDCSAIALGDLDADGDLDLAALEPLGGRVEVHFNDGLGNFEQATQALVGAQIPHYLSAWLELADLDNDGDLDVLTNSVTGGASTFFNDGQGRFAAAVNSMLWGNGYVAHIVVGDINGDGFPDIISNLGGSSTSGISFHLGDGTGHFTPASAANTIPSFQEQCFALGDFDADGDLDLAAGGGSTGGYVVMMVNDGTGQFTGFGSNSIQAGERGDLALVDLDGDGDLDLLSSGSGNSNGVLVALNQPYRPPVVGGMTPTSGFVGATVQITGSFLNNTTGVRFNGTAATTFTINSPTQLTATVPVGATTGPVTVENGVGTGSSPGVFTVLQTALITSYSPQPRAVSVPAGAPIVLGLSQPIPASSFPRLLLATSQSVTGAYQVSGNGTTTATLTRTSAFRPGEKVTVVLPSSFPVASAYQYRPQLFDFTVATGGSGRGAFTGTTALPGSPQAVATRVADFNGDGFLDAVTVNTGYNTSRMYLGSSQGFTPQPFPASYPDLQDLAVADIDLDGDLDLVGLSTAGRSGTAGVVTYYNSGTGSFSSSFPSDVGVAPTSLAVGDMNADGRPDVVTANAGSSNLTVIPNGYSGFWSQPQGTYALPAAPYGVALADVDADGDLDMLVTYPTLNTVGLLRNDGRGVFVVEPATVPVGSSPHALAAEDLDQDGDVDLAVSNAAAGTVSLRWGNGQGGFSSGPDLIVGATPGVLALADIDADGDLDLLTTSPATGTIALLRNNGQGSFAAAPSVTVGGTPVTLVLGDLDADGDLDLLAADQGAGTLEVRLNSATLSATGAPTWAGAVALFPNPARTEATLQLPSLPAAHLTVCNVLGQQVLDRHVAANTASVVLDVHTLPPGLYLLRLDAGKDGQFIRQLVVR